MPDATTARAAWASGSLIHELVEPADKLKLTMRMLYSRALYSTQSRPAITSAVLPVPSAPSTRTSMMAAPGATPVLSSPAR